MLKVAFVGKAEDSRWGWERSAGIWPGCSWELMRGMAFLGWVEKGNPLQQLRSDHPPLPASRGRG